MSFYIVLLACQLGGSDCFVINSEEASLHDCLQARPVPESTQQSIIDIYDLKGLGEEVYYFCETRDGDVVEGLAPKEYKERRMETFGPCTIEDHP